MDVFSQIEEVARKHFLIAKGSHDWQHIKRVHDLCMIIGKKENADLEILRYAAVLHDIGRDHQDTLHGSVSHAEHGSIIARKLLEKYRIDHEKTDKIVHCVESHSFRGKKQPQSKEAEILFDADKLDSIGAVGVGRAFLFAGEIGATLHDDEVDINETVYERRHGLQRIYVQIKKNQR